MTNVDSLLVEVLATTDATWLPQRGWTGLRGANTSEVRRTFAAHGVAMNCASGDDAIHKQTQRLLSLLIRTGKLVGRRPPGVKLLHVRLPEATEAEYRRRCGLPGMYSAWCAVRRLAEHTSYPPTLLTDYWISERLLVPAGADQFELQGLETMLLPALSRAFVYSNSDCHGRVSYALPNAGIEWAVGKPPPREEMPIGEPALETEYTRVLLAAVKRLEKAKLAEPRQIGYIPLPCSMGGLPFIERGLRARVQIEP